MLFRSSEVPRKIQRLCWLQADLCHSERSEESAVGGRSSSSRSLAGARPERSRRARDDKDAQQLAAPYLFSKLLRQDTSVRMELWLFPQLLGEKLVGVTGVVLYDIF